MRGEITLVTAALVVTIFGMILTAIVAAGNPTYVNIDHQPNALAMPAHIPAK